MASLVLCEVPMRLVLLAVLCLVCLGGVALADGPGGGGATGEGVFWAPLGRDLWPDINKPYFVNGEITDGPASWWAYAMRQSDVLYPDYPSYTSVYTLGEVHACACWLKRIALCLELVTFVALMRVGFQLYGDWMAGRRLSWWPGGKGDA